MTRFDSVPFNNTQLLMRSSNMPVVGMRLKEHEFTSIISATLQALSVNFFTKHLLCSSPPSSLRTHNFVNSMTSLFLQQGAQITGAGSAEGLIFCLLLRLTFLGSSAWNFFSCHPSGA
jgi:hypothetical protein